MCVPAVVQAQRTVRHNHEARIRSLEREVSQDVSRLKLVVDCERTGLDGDGILTYFGGGLYIYLSEGLVEPPGALDCFHGFTIALYRVEIRPFDNNIQLFGHLFFDSKTISGLETAIGREFFLYQLVTKLHSAVPRITSHPILLECKLVCPVEVNIFPGLAAGCDVDIIQRQHVMLQAPGYRCPFSRDFGSNLCFGWCRITRLLRQKK